MDRTQPTHGKPPFDCHGAPVGRAAELVGYATPNAFAAAFRRVTELPYVQPGDRTSDEHPLDFQRGHRCGHRPRILRRIVSAATDIPRANSRARYEMSRPLAGCAPRRWLRAGVVRQLLMRRGGKAASSQALDSRWLY